MKARPVRSNVGYLLHNFRIKKVMHISGRNEDQNIIKRDRVISKRPRENPGDIVGASGEKKKSIILIIPARFVFILSDFAARFLDTVITPGAHTLPESFQCAYRDCTKNISRQNKIISFEQLRKHYRPAVHRQPCFRREDS